MASNYTIKTGDTLSGIAAANGTTIAELQKSNPTITDPNKIFAGSSLVIPDRVTATPGAGGVQPMSTNDLQRGITSPNPTSLIQTNPGPTFSDTVSKVASTTLTSNQQVIDSLRKQLEDQAAKDKAAAQQNVDTVTSEIKKDVGTTKQEDTFRTLSDRFKIEENIQRYTDIQNKIVAAQEALNMGLIYEQDRPARMELINGRSASLQRQGLATIGALQGTAEVIKGNIDLAYAYVNQTLDAITADQNTSRTALNTLLNLANDKLVDLTDEERKIVDDRIKAIDDQAKKLDDNKDKVLDLMTKYPKAFQDGGVTLLDTYESALQKMLPTMAADERTKFEASLKKTTDGKLTDAQVSEYKGQMLTAKNAGMTYSEAVLAFGDVLPIDYINSVYGRKSSQSGEDIATDAYYNQFIDPATGGIKAGYTVTVDPKNGRPVVTKSETEGDGFWKNIGDAFGSIFK